MCSDGVHHESVVYLNVHEHGAERMGGTVLPWILCSVFAGIALVLAIRLALLNNSMKEICRELRERLEVDTNTLISVSSGDRYARRLAAELNKQLRILRRQRKQYLSGNLELKEAVTNISHDLRTPLTAIFGYLELLEEEEKTEIVERYINVIRNRAEMLKRLTEELFQYSVIISSENRQECAPVSVGDVLEESIAAFYTTLCGRGITPDIKMPEEKVFRRLDSSALSRVFANLLSNAVKYSDGDLEITLSAEGNITFSNRASELNEVLVGKLFDRFYTVETARKSTGLGLSIARTLVEQMGGTIGADYVDGRVRIYVTLPEE